MKKFLFCAVAIFFATTSFAQVDEATVTVIGTGVNEEQATQQALRSAIEQTFGAFVSANTSILNDELVKDEIVSVSTGNVKEYKKIAVATMSNGNVSVSLTATVSINKLISYAKSKGSKAEFAGSVYAENINLIRLKVQSVIKAYDLMMQQLEHIAEDLFDFQIEIGEPKRGGSEGSVYCFDSYVNIMSNTASTNFYNLYTRTIKEFLLTEDEIDLCLNERIQLTNYANLSDYNEDRFNQDRFSSDRFYGKVLPIPVDTILHRQERLENSIFKAMYSYAIVEIDKTKNSFAYYESPKDYPGVDFYDFSTGRWRNRTLRKGDLLLCANMWNGTFIENISKKENKLSFRGNIRDFESIKTETPNQLSQEQLRGKNKDQLKNSTHSISYTPRLITRHRVNLVIPANSIANFKGFQVVRFNVLNIEE